MRLIFLGSGAFGLPTLQALQREHEIALVISQPDKPAGRKRQLTPTPVAAWALEQGLDVMRVEDVNTPEHVQRIRDVHADASVIIAFGQKLSEELVDALGELAINLHGSLLPKWRGAAPIQRAVMAGDCVAGVSVIGIAQRMDAGPVYAMAELDVRPTDTSGDLHDRMALLGPEAIQRVLHDLAHDALNPQPQDEAEVTQARKLKKADGTIDFDQPTQTVRAMINGLNPWPGVTVDWTDANGTTQPLMLRRVDSGTLNDTAQERDAVPGTVLDGLRVRTADGCVQLLELQAPGTKVMDAATFAAGRQLAPGARLAPRAR